MKVDGRELRLAGWDGEPWMKPNGFMNVAVLVKREPGCELPLPHYASEGAAGFDLRSAVDIDLPPGQVVVVPTGFCFAIPPGYELQIRMRGGTAKRGILLANAPGTVDSDYVGQVMLLLLNSTSQPISVKQGERLAQGVLNAVPQAEFIEAAELPKTQRADGRFNSTGRV